MYEITENDSLNQQTEPYSKGFKNKIEEFQKIYMDSYGISLSENEAEVTLIEITQLLEEIIRINYLKALC